MQLKVQGLKEALRKIDGIPKQVRFAASQAINDTALDVQKHEVETVLPSHITLRAKGAPWQKPGSRFGVNIKPFATKASLKAVIGSMADWLHLVEIGGQKQISGGRIAIPTPFVKPQKDIIRKERKPRFILRRKSQLDQVGGHPFVYEGAKMPKGIWQRTGKQRTPLRLLFGFKESAPVKAVLRFFDDGSIKAVAVFPSHFTKRFENAMKTAK